MTSMDPRAALDWAANRLPSDDRLPAIPDVPKLEYKALYTFLSAVKRNLAAVAETAVTTRNRTANFISPLNMVEGSVKIVSQTTDGQGNVYQIDSHSNDGFLLFKHSRANPLGSVGAYTPVNGKLRTALFVGSAGIAMGYNRTSDGAWVSTINLDGISGDVDITGTLTAGSVIAGSVTILESGTPLSTIEANAAAASALLSTKLNRDAADILTGAIDIQSAGGFKTGTIAWDSSGNVTSGSGVAITSKGIVAANSGTPKLTLNGTTGDATFAGALSAATGTFTGTVTAGAIIAGSVTIQGSGTPLSTVEANAAAVSTKLSAVSSDILSGAITVNSAGGFRAGTLTWDASGNITGGSGVAMTAKGIAATNAGTPTFALSAVDGSATFAGDVDTNGKVIARGNITVSATSCSMAANPNFAAEWGIVSWSDNTSGAAIKANASSGADGVWANCSSGNGAAVYGTTSQAGGSCIWGQSVGASSYAVRATNGFGVALWLESGTFKWGSTVQISTPPNNTTTFLRGDGQWAAPGGGGGGGGTVTSITAGAGLTGGTITTSGTIAINATVAVVSGVGFAPGVDNAYTLGGGSLRWTDVYAVSGVVRTSDARQKVVLGRTPLGLDFIKSLSPVSYRWKVAQNLMDPVDPKRIVSTRAGVRTFHGLVAQDVKAVADRLGVEFAGWVQINPDDPESAQGLRYSEFIAPIVRAIQELDAKVESLSSGVRV